MEGKRTDLFGDASIPKSSKPTVPGAGERSHKEDRSFTFDHSFWSTDVSDPHYASQVQSLAFLRILHSRGPLRDFPLKKIGAGGYHISSSPRRRLTYVISFFLLIMNRKRSIQSLVSVYWIMPFRDTMLAFSPMDRRVQARRIR